MVLCVCSRSTLSAVFLIALVWTCSLTPVPAQSTSTQTESTKPRRPNVLVVISDDQSYPHASAYGDPAIKTPGFDRVARDGVLFHNAFTPAPGCSPMRAAFLTGREIWQIREAGTHASSFPTDLTVYPKLLEDAGYHVGMTGKGWGPGKATGWPNNPAGKAYSNHKLKPPKGISGNDYAANFDDFLDARSSDEPFCFWFGAHEPHRVFGSGLGKQSGIDLNLIRVPGFLPDSPTVRSDLADYLFEIQWFDSHLVRMLDRLKQDGELENTFVIVTSDNGMSFPRAKANVYEHGIHMPLAVSWPARIKAGQDHRGLVSLIDVTRTIVSAAGLGNATDTMTGIDLLPALTGEGALESGTKGTRRYVYSGRERHSSSRFNSLGYPARCVRSERYLYIRNFAPERYPAGTPQKFARAKYDAEGELVEAELGKADGGYHDIDACPTLDWMIANKSSPDVKSLMEAAVGLRPREELYDIQSDPACLNNLAVDSSKAGVLKEHAERLETYLRETGDVRVISPEQANVWETYPRYSPLRWFPTPAWAVEKPQAVPKQPWLEKRRPR